MRVVQKLVAAAAVGASLFLAPTLAAAQQTVRIGQATSALSFMPIWGARALDTFAPNGLSLTIAVVPGGDPNALAALDSGDIDLAAVGSEAVLRAAAKGQPFQIVSSLMSKVTLELVVSKEFLEKAGVKPTDPLPKRLAALKGALVGVSSIGGAQDTAARWLAAKGGLDPKTDIKVAQVGNPPALLAALENKRIDAFVLSPPQGFLAEASGAGVVLVKMGDDFPALANLPFLVLVAKKPADEKATDLTVRTLKALRAASADLVAKPEPTALAIQSKFFAKASPESIVSAVKAMASGVADGGRLNAEGFQNLIAFAKEVGTDLGKDYDAKAMENDIWTNAFIDKAK